MLKKWWNKLIGKEEEPTYTFQKLDTTSNLSLEEKVNNALLGMFGPENLAKMKAFDLDLGVNRFEYKGLSFDTFGWTLEKEHPEDHYFSWTCDHYPIGLSLNYFDLVPDLPPEKDINHIRDMYWNHGVPILKTDFYQLGEVFCVENLFKTVFEDKVVQYNANITVPFENQSFVLKLIAEDYGSTGIRDALVFPFIEGDFYENATIYPYDETREGRMTVAEQEEYDHLLPFHHLTVLRKVFPKLLASISLEKPLQDCSPFYKKNE